MPHIAAIQMTSTNDVEINLQTAARFIAQAAAQGATLIALPEMFVIFGTDTEKKAARETFGVGKIQTFLSEQAKQHKIWLIGGTIPLICDIPNKSRAACLVYNPEGICVARYDKMHLFDVQLNTTTEIYRESDFIEPGTEIKTVETSIGKVGLSVCYDVRFPELYRHLSEQGAEILSVPSAFTVPTGQAHWEILLRARAIENQCYVLAPAQTGQHNAKRQTYGHSVIIDPWGKIIAQREAGEGVIVAEVDLNYLKEVRRKIPALQHRKI